MFRAVRAPFALMLLWVAAPALASPKPCRDASGRVVACPKTAKAAPERCKDAAGRFVRCGTAAVKPVPAQH